MAGDADRSELIEAATAMVEQSPDGEQALEALLEVDAETETWTFDDIPLDSGTFGQVVADGLVEKIDGEYRLADSALVAAVLEDDERPLAETATGDETTTGDDGSLRDVLSHSIGTRVEPRVLASLGGVLFVLFLTRIIGYRSVFRDGYVVSPGNDPYYYRYWLEKLLAESDGLTDTTILTETVPEASNRPFTHAANWFVAELLGGSQWAAEAVAVWLPVVSSLVVGLLVFWLAVIVTDDVRVGLAAVLLLAFTPVHAVYSGLGYLEHRLHQYAWLAVTLVTLAWLAVDLQQRQAGRSSLRAGVVAHLRCPWTWVAAFFLGLSLTFSAHAWGGSVLLLVPAAAYVGLKVALDVRAGLSPLAANAPILAGLGFAGLSSALLHFRWGWHEPFMAVVPALVCGGALGVVTLGEGWRRVGLPVKALLALEVVLAGVALLAFRAVRTDDWVRLRSRADDLFFREGITETVSLFTPEYMVIFGPVAQIGVWFYLAVAVLAWAVWVALRRYEPAWLLLSVYTVYWTVLAALQVRFGAQLAVSLAVLGGVGFVSLLAWLDLVRPPVPFREATGKGRDARPGRETPRTAGKAATPSADGGERGDASIHLPSLSGAGYLLCVSLLVLGLSLVFLPTLVGQTTYDGEQLEAALVIDEHAAEADREWRDNAVFSTMGSNRMYNYFVSGEAAGYHYTQGADRYHILITDPDSRLDWFDGRFGYAIADGSFGLTPEHLGAGGAVSLDHYQLLYRSPDGDLGAFAVVPGVTIAGSGEPGAEIPVETDVEVPGDSFTYERTVVVDEDGSYEVTVPYPGEYTVGTARVSVTQADVLNGTSVEVPR